MKAFHAVYKQRCFLVGILILGVGGCGGNNLLSVSGKVFNGKDQLKEGAVTFHPDAAKATKGQKTASGEIENGKFTLFTGKEAGVAPGWYKVTVVANEPIPSDATGEDMYAEPKLLVDEIYTQESTTTLTIEVKAGAPEGHYDLKLDKK